MISITRTNSENPDFRDLVRRLDQYLHGLYGQQQTFYNQFNKLETIQHVVVLYDDGKPTGCGAFRKYAEDTVEIKRMFVLPESRGRGIGEKIVAALEAWASELGFTNSILETGKIMTEANRLYQKTGYTIIPNYGQYKDVESSVCMGKQLLQVSQ